MDNTKQTVLDLQDRVYRLEQRQREVLHKMEHLSTLLRQLTDTTLRLVRALIRKINAK